MDKLKEEPIFYFLGNQLALDFVNTRPVIDGESRELLPDFGSILDWFSAAGLIEPHAVSTLRSKWRDRRRNETAWKTLIEFREMLREEVLHWEQEGEVRLRIAKEVNAAMRLHPMLRRVSRNGKTYSLESWFSPESPEDLIAPVAQSAAELLAVAGQHRVRKCEQCVLHFLDTSKKGSRRWCSMQFCGNRAKVAAYAARQREKG